MHSCRFPSPDRSESYKNDVFGGKGQPPFHSVRFPWMHHRKMPMVDIYPPLQPQYVAKHEKLQSLGEVHSQEPLWLPPNEE